MNSHTAIYVMNTGSIVCQLSTFIFPQFVTSARIVVSTILYKFIMLYTVLQLQRILHFDAASFFCRHSDMQMQGPVIFLDITEVDTVLTGNVHYLTEMSSGVMLT